MADDATEIVEKAANPKRVSGDEGSIEERSVAESIEADRYNESKQATRSRNPLAGLVRRASPPGGHGS